MRLSERPCLSGLDQSGRPQHRAWFTNQDLEITVQGQRFGAFVQRPGMTRHDDRSVQDLKIGGPETDPYLAPGEAHWHRVVGLTDTDPGFVIHPGLEDDRHIERLNRCGSGSVGRPG
jgi:hypothetical protein